MIPMSTKTPPYNPPKPTQVIPASPYLPSIRDGYRRHETVSKKKGQGIKKGNENKRERRLNSVPQIGVLIL
jgi:hypothetical protein